MRVGIDAHTLGSQSSGNEDYCLRLLREIAEVKANGDRYLIYFAHSKALPRIPAVEQFTARRIFPATPLIRMPIFFPVECRRASLDILHVQYFIPPFCNCKIVTTIHDILFESHPQFYSRFENFYFRALIPRSALRADHIITVSEFSKREIVNRYQVDPSKVSVAHHRIREECRVLDRDECREVISQKFGIETPFILYVGRVNARKNLIRLVEAFAQLYRKGARQTLVVVGKCDWMAEKVQQRVKELGLEAVVKFTGYVEASDIPVFYNAAEMLVFPSICEGFGLPVIEAMACGLPVVTSYGSALEEVSGGAAMLVDPYSIDSIAVAMEKVISDQQLAACLRANGLQRAQAFQGTSQPGQTVSIYHQLCGGN